MSEDRRIAVYRAGNQTEGNFVRGLLAQEGIPVTASSEGSGPRGAQVEVELQVPDRYAEAAQRIIQAYEEQVDAPSGTESSWTCQRCGEENEASFDACWNCQAAPGHA